MTMFDPPKQESALRKVAKKIESNRYATIGVFVLAIVLGMVIVYNVYQGYELKKQVEQLHESSMTMKIESDTSVTEQNIKISNSDKPSLIITPAPESITLDWNTFESISNGYSIKYPTEFKTAEIDMSGYLYEAAENSSTFYFYDPLRSEESERYLTIEIARNKITWPEEWENRSVIINETPATFYTNADSNFELDIYVIELLNGNFMQISVSNNEEHKALAEQIISTLEVND